MMCSLCVMYVVCVYVRMYVKAINKNISLNTSHLLCFIPRDYLFW